MDMDLNIENYSLIELMVVLDLSEQPTREEVQEKSQQFIDKFTQENKLVLADFFIKARDQVLEYLDSVDKFEESYQLLLEDQLNNVCSDDMENQTAVYLDDDTLIKANDCQMNINPQYSNVLNRMIVINSEYINTEASSEYIVDFSEPISDVISISLYSFHIPYTWYNIDEANATNSFTITTDSDVVIDIESGNYKSASLMDSINNKLSSYDSSCLYSMVNGKVTITLGKDVSSVCFYKESSSSRSNNNLGYIMGFRKSLYSRPDGITDIWTITGEAIMNLNGTKYIQLMLDDYSKNRLNTNIINIVDNNSSYINPTTHFNHKIERNANDEVIETTPRSLTQNQIFAINQIESNNSQNARNLKTRNINTSDMFAMIPSKHHSMQVGEMCSEFGGTLQNNKRTYFGPISLSRLHVKLLDDKGNMLNLNGNDWSFTIICETLYQGTQKK